MTAPNHKIISGIIKTAPINERAAGMINGPGTSTPAMRNPNAAGDEPIGKATGRPVTGRPTVGDQVPIAWIQA